jgi:hypothetical protein
LSKRKATEERFTKWIPRMSEAVDTIHKKHDYSKEKLLSRMKEEERVCIREYAILPGMNKRSTAYQ